jgi:hypothetical protein
MMIAVTSQIHSGTLQANFNNPSKIDEIIARELEVDVEAISPIYHKRRRSALVKILCDGLNQTSREEKKISRLLISAAHKIASVCKLSSLQMITRGSFTTRGGRGQSSGLLRKVI